MDAQAWSQIVPALTLLLNVAGVIILYVYTRETVRMRRAIEQELKMLADQQRAAIAPDPILTGPGEFIEDTPPEFATQSHRGAIPPFVLVTVKNIGGPALEPLAFVRTTYPSAGFRCLTDYGKPGILHDEIMPFFFNTEVPRETLTSIAHDRFGDVGTRLLDSVVDGQDEPFLAIICRDRRLNLYPFIWAVQTDGPRRFLVPGFRTDLPVWSKTGEVIA